MPAQQSQNTSAQTPPQDLALIGWCPKLPTSLPVFHCQSNLPFLLSRYVIVVYIQPKRFADTASALANASSPLTNFNLMTFATSAQLGNPIAGTFFLLGPSTETNSTAPAAASNGALMGRQAIWSMTGALALTTASFIQYLGCRSHSALLFI